MGAATTPFLQSPDPLRLIFTAPFQFLPSSPYLHVAWNWQHVSLMKALEV